MHIASERMQATIVNVVMQGIWSRALGLAIERPKSVTMEVIEAAVAK